MYAKPHEIGAFQYSSVVFAAIFGWMVFRESLDTATIVGTILVCIGGYLSISGRTDNSEEPEKGPNALNNT